MMQSTKYQVEIFGDVARIKGKMSYEEMLELTNLYKSYGFLEFEFGDVIVPMRLSVKQNQPERLNEKTP